MNKKIINNSDKINKKYFIALYANIALQNKELKFNSTKGKPYDIPYTFKNEIRNRLNLISNNEIKEKLEENLIIFFADIKKTKSESWLNIIRNYYSHTTENSRYKDNEEKYGGFKENSLIVIRSLMNEYLKLKETNSDLQKYNLTDEIYILIYLSLFLTKQEFNSMYKHSEYIANWTKYEQEAFEIIFNGKKHLLTKLRIWNDPKIEIQNFEYKIKLLKNINYHLEGKGQDKVRINKFHCFILSELFKKYNLKFEIRNIYNKYCLNNPWVNKSKPFKYNYALLTFPNGKEYKYLNYKSLRNLVFQVLNSKEINDTTIYNIVKSKSEFNPSDKKQSQKTLEEITKTLQSHFEPTNPKPDVISSLKMLNKILLSESNIINEDRKDTENQILELSKLAPSQDQFFKLAYFCRENKVDKFKQLYKEVYAENDTIFDFAWNDNHSIIQNLNTFIYDYIKNNLDTILKYNEKNKHWKNQTNHFFQDGIKKAGIKINFDFQNDEINKHLLLLDSKITFSKPDISNSKLFNVIRCWEPVINLINKHFSTENEKKFKKWDWNNEDDFKKLISEKNVKEYFDKSLGEIFVPRSIVEASENNEILSNYHIYKSQIYSTLSEINKKIFNSEYNIINLSKKYMEQELFLVKKQIENENNISSDFARKLRNCILHRFKLEQIEKEFFTQETNAQKLLEWFNKPNL